MSKRTPAREPGPYGQNQPRANLNKYATGQTQAAQKDARIGRLKREMRDNIRFLGDYPPLSNDWLRMTESLHQISTLARGDANHLLVQEKNPLNMKGKKEGGTLWDGEKDQIAIRILLEEGKLNLILRVLHAYRDVLSSGNYDEMVSECCSKHKSDPTSVHDRCRVFEQSLGSILLNAFDHVEALQILDVPEFLDHVKGVLQDSQEEVKRKQDFSQMQETMVIHYLYKLTNAFDNIDEERVLDLIQQKNVLLNLSDELNTHSHWYDIATLKMASRFYANIFGSESYLTEPLRFVSSKGLKQIIVSFKGKFVNELVKKHGLARKDVRPLLDQFLKWEREVGKTKIVPLETTESTPSIDPSDQKVQT